LSSPPSVLVLLLSPHRHGGCTRIWA